MGRIGFGPGRFHPRRRGGNSAPVPQLDLIAPSASWDGTAASGFAVTPSDPTRATAKPVVRIIVPPHQAFTDKLLVGVYAGANDGGSLLDNMGLEKVTAHYEGTSVDIAAPSFQSFDDANGNPVTYFGWWVRLDHNGAHGIANVYFEAVPKDATMQNRVVGPYPFLPSAALYDLELEIAASPAEVVGSRYRTLASAFAYSRSVGAQHPRFLITETGNYTCPVGGAVYDAKGRVTIEARVPVTIGEASNPTFDGTKRIRPPQPVHWKGANITLNFRYVVEHYWETTGLTAWHWFDGCTLTGGERYVMWGGQPKPSIISQLVRGFPWFTECTLEYTWNSLNNASLVRGCTVGHTYNDMVDGARAVLGSTFSDHDSGDYKNDLPMMTVTYSGSETTATFKCTGSNQTSRTFTATWGANSASLALTSAVAEWNAGTNRFSAVVAWLNGLGVGFAATLLDDTRVAAAATLPEIASAKPFTTPQNVKDAVLTVTARFDLHGDWYQQASGIPLQNVVIADNRCFGMVAQCIFMNQSNISDLLIVNNAWSQKASGQYQSQLGQMQSHVVVAHNDLEGQVLTLSPSDSYDGDGYCLVANNVALDLWGGDADITVANNHLFSGAVGITVGTATGTTIAGTGANLFADAANGDFSPAGALLDSRKVPVMRFDRARLTRGALAAPGACR